MSHPNSSPPPNSESGSTSGFSAQAQMGLAEVMQMCCHSRRSGQIMFHSGESHGYIYIQHGRILHALCGKAEGDEAIYTMLTWPGGGFSLDEGILPHKKTVELTWEQLLFEGARRADIGMTGPKSNSPTITKAEPLTLRTAEGQPKVTVTRPDLPAFICTLAQEYTHVGRAAGNEIVLPYPSISNRHCIFIQSGPDVVLRDLNSSNGTYVNNEIVSEVILRPGDHIEVGSVHMKFEPGVKRPKLMAPEMPTQPTQTGYLKKQASGGALYYQTVRISNPKERPGKETKVKDDSVFVKGESAISYDNLAKPVTKKKRRPGVIAAIVAAALACAGAGCFLFLHYHGAH